MKNTRAFVAVALLFVAPLDAQEPLDAQDKITELDGIFGWVAPETPRCAVAASHEGEVVVNRAYGSWPSTSATPSTATSGSPA